ncbi:GroES-like protein [Atractiella rhizophila]|nr:GroES-like protein [Atractiella rhizophila]
MSSETMLSAWYVPGNDQAVLKRVPVPTPAPDEVLLEVKACGLCHTEVWLLTEVNNPSSFIMGHEIAGVAVKLGSTVDPTHVDLGHLYVVYVDDPCVRGLNIAEGVGIGRNGGYAEYVTVKASQLVPVPHGLPPELACLTGDCSTTAFHAITETAQVRPGMRVMIFGIGGLGLQAVQICVDIGATVYAVDLKPSSRKLALDNGAKAAYDAIELNALNAAGELNMDVTIDFVGKAITFAQAFAAVKNTALKFERAPKMVCVGVAAEPVNISTTEIVQSQVQILGSLYGSKANVQTTLELMSKGVLKPLIHTVPLEKINASLTDLRAANVKNRRVVIPTPAASSFQWAPPRQ